MPLSCLLALGLFSAQDEGQTVPLTLVPSGITQHIGGYPSIQVSLSSRRPAGLSRPPAGIANALYGTLRLGGRTFYVVLATFGNTTHLFVDSNSDGDMTNDPIASWHPRKGHANASGFAQVRLPFKDRHVLCTVLVAQSAPKTLTVVSDYGFLGRVRLGGRAIPFYIVDGAERGFPRGSAVGAVLGIDRKGNGVISGPAEQYPGDAPFTVSGTSLALRSVDTSRATATFLSGDRVAEIPLPSELRPKAPAPSFATKALDGKTVNFPGDFNNRVVLLYVWATWSQPSLDWLPRVTKAYDAYKNLGFSVLGISLNRATETDLVRAATAQMPWVTGFDGTSWSCDAARTLSINAIPYVLLVDGKSGRIIATMDELVGDKFESVIRASVVGG